MTFRILLLNSFHYCHNALFSPELFLLKNTFADRFTQLGKKERALRFDDRYLATSVISTIQSLRQ